MIAAVVTLTLIGGLSGAGLALASTKFHVEKDERYEKILDMLPGSNCGGCGYPGCQGMADAIIKGNANASLCPSATQESLISINDLMGTDLQVVIKKIPTLLCSGDMLACKPLAYYSGVPNCGVMASIGGAGKPCLYGCLGGGDCVRSCSHNAITMSEVGLPVIDESKCISCGMCSKNCPRNLLEMVSVDKPVIVRCKSLDRGSVVKKICDKGCIGCKICERNCENKAISVNNNIALVDTEKCDGCLKCIDKCPVKIIQNSSNSF